MVTSIDAMYKAAQLEMGVTQQEIDMSSEFYSQSLQPYLDDLNIALAEQELNAGPNWLGILGGSALIAAAFFFPPLAAPLVGAGATIIGGSF